MCLTKGESIYVPSNTRHRATALEPGTPLDVFTPVRQGPAWMMLVRHHRHFAYIRRKGGEAQLMRGRIVERNVYTTAQKTFT